MKHTKGKVSAIKGCEEVVRVNVAYIKLKTSTIATVHRINVSEEEGEANAKHIAHIWNHWEELLETAEMLQQKLEVLIACTPSGKRRNDMTDDNIKASHVISKAQQPDKTDTPSKPIKKEEDVKSKILKMLRKMNKDGEYFNGIQLVYKNTWSADEDILVKKIIKTIQKIK